MHLRIGGLVSGLSEYVIKEFNGLIGGHLRVAVAQVSVHKADVAISPVLVVLLGKSAGVGG